MNSVKTTQTQVVTGLLVFLALLSMKKWRYFYVMEPLWLSTCTTGMQPDHHHSKKKCLFHVVRIASSFGTELHGQFHLLAHQDLLHNLVHRGAHCPIGCTWQELLLFAGVGVFQLQIQHFSGARKGTNYGRGQQKREREARKLLHIHVCVHYWLHSQNLQTQIEYPAV